MTRAHFASFQPFCIDFTPDGRLLVVSALDRVLRREPDGSLMPHADLSNAGPGYWNEIVVDGRGNAYLNDVGFDMPAGEQPSPGAIALLASDGPARQVAEGVTFPNGMAVMADNSTLICAESYARKLTAFDIAADGSLSNQRTWAYLGDGVPDGICADADNGVWYADVPNKRCVRVREGGEVAQAIQLELGCFACMLDGPERRTCTWLRGNGAARRAWPTVSAADRSCSPTYPRPAPVGPGPRADAQAGGTFWLRCRMLPGS